MSKVRVSTLAKELGIPSKEAVAWLNANGEYVKSPASTIEASVERKLREDFPVKAQLRDQTERHGRRAVERRGVALANAEPAESQTALELTRDGQAQASVDDGTVGPDDIYSGNLYVELPGDNWTRGRERLKASCTALTRRFPAIQDEARSATIPVEQFLLETMFAHLMPAQLSMAALTLQGDEKINIALRVSGDSRPNWPLPKGVALIAKASWQLKSRSGTPLSNRALTISSFHDGPPGDTRAFEASLDVTCIQTARMEPGAQRTRNVLGPSLAQALPAISELTRGRLKDWSDFLEWKRRLIRANREALRYTSRAVGADQRSVVFTAVGPSEEALRQAIDRLARSDVLAAFDTSASEDEWDFQLPEGEREPRGSEIGRKTRGKAKVEPLTDAENLPWANSVTAAVTFALSDDALAAIESSDDSSALERALNRVPASGFIVQSTVQDVSQVDRQDRALRELSDQGGYSPYLARHIFDAAEARTPGTQIRVDNWINTHLNSAQRSAVQKVLSAPDLCLIQGPPGTGKTTVIAESIVQLAQRNETVLLASQTHTAVDNALNRLPFHPSIRAVRLTRNESRLSDEGLEFLNERALGRYYKSLASAVESRRKAAQAEARFADQFTRFQTTATRHIDELAAAEGRVDTLMAEVANAADTYIRLGQQLRASGVQIACLDDRSQIPARLVDLDQSIESLRSSLPGVEANMDSVLAERPLPTATPSGGRRSELTAQLADVLERMKADASAVSEYQRLQAELSELGEEGASDDESHKALQTYFPDAAWLLEAPSKSVMALLQKGKRTKTGKDVLRRIGIARTLLPQLDQARAELEARTGAHSDAESALHRERQNVQANFTEPGRAVLLGGAGLDSPPTAADVRERLRALVDENAERVSRAKVAEIEDQAWGDIQDDWIADLTTDGVAERDWEALGDDWLSECNVVGVTCNENPKTLDDPGLTNFDLAIIDEVSKATPLELLMPLMRARRAALVGDHRQLPPMFREGQDAEGLTEEADEEIAEELALTPENVKKYEKFVTASLFRTHFERADESIKERLTVQHRMHPDIMDSVNRFYEGQLTCGINSPDAERAHGLSIRGRGDLPVISPDKHMVWIDTTHDDQGRPWTEPAPNSDQARTNLLEARLIARMLRDIDDALAQDPANAGKHKEIGVVSMYQAQVRCIRQEIAKATKGKPFKAINHELNTVVKYQGKEKPIILVSMVRNFGPRASNRRRSSRANVARFEYINVAFSRAQELLVVFGARDTFAPYQVELPPMDATGTPRDADVYREICDVVERNGAMKQASALGELPPTGARGRGR